MSLYNATTLRNFDTRWDQALLSTSETLQDNVLESLYNVRIRESAQRQTVLAMHEQAIDQNRSKPSYHKLETMASRHLDQMIRTQNFMVRNQRIDTGVLVKTRKVEKCQRGRRTAECCLWKAKGQCSKGDSCSVRHEDNQRGKKTQSSSPAPR